MKTFLAYAIGLVAVAGVLFLVTSFLFGRGEEMAQPPPDGTPVELPEDRPATGADLRALRLSVAVRGYRMNEVDWVIDQLASQLDERDRELSQLRAVVSAPGSNGTKPDQVPSAEPDGVAPTSAEPQRVEAPRAEPQRVEAPRAEPQRVEAPRAEPQRVQPARVPTQGADAPHDGA